MAALDFDVFYGPYDLLTLIECHIAQFLAEAETRPKLAALAEAWLLPEAERLADGAAVGRLDELFHAQLVQGSSNREMARVHRSFTERIGIIRRLDFNNTARVAATYDEHARILGAITRRRADDAQRLLRALIAQRKRRCATSRWTSCTGRVGRRDEAAVRRQCNSPCGAR